MSEPTCADLADQVEEARQKVAAFLRAQGWLPDGVELEVEPMDLQVDAKWMARGPIVVDYFTDQPARLLNPDAPPMTEEQKQAAAEAASAQIEQWQAAWDDITRPSDEFLADLANPIRLEPRATQFRDKPRRREYPNGG